MATYTVRRGDSLTSIAKKHGTTATALIAANKAKVGANPDRIYSGTVLAVPTKAANAGRSDDGVNRGGGSAKASPSKSAPAKKSPSSSGSSRGKSYSERKPDKPNLSGGGSSPKSSSSRGGGRGSSYTERGVGGPKAGTGRKRGTAYKG